MIRSKILKIKSMPKSGLLYIVASLLIFSAGYLLATKPWASMPLTGQAELNHVTALVAKHYLLPTNETPALVTVTDTKKLTSPFLKKSLDGDKILVYQKNRIAII